MRSTIELGLAIARLGRHPLERTANVDIELVYVVRCPHCSFGRGKEQGYKASSVPNPTHFAPLKTARQRIPKTRFWEGGIQGGVIIHHFLAK